MPSQLSLVLGTQPDPNRWWHNIDHQRQPFAELLESLGAAEVAEMLAARPDLMDPEPRTFTDFTVRVMSVSSVARHVRELDRFTTQVLETLALLSQDRAAGWLGSVRAESFAALLGETITEDDVEQALSRLGSAGLLFRSGMWTHLNPAIGTINLPAGLAPPAAELLARINAEELKLVARYSGADLDGAKRKGEIVAAVAARLADPAAVLAIVDEAPPAAAARARALAHGKPQLSHHYWDVYQYARRSEEDTICWLVRRGLVVASAPFDCTMPREVSMALRGGQIFPGATAARPSIAVSARPVEDLDGWSATTADHLVAGVGALLEVLSSRPAPALKAGGLGVRELRRLAEQIGRSEPDTAELLELAGAAGLVLLEYGADGSSRLLATRHYDSWSALTPAERWADLAAAWMAAEQVASAVRLTDLQGKPFPPLAGTFNGEGIARYRRSVIGVLLTLEPGFSCDTDDLAEAASWSLGGASPVREFSAFDLTEFIVAEMETLGMAVKGALSTPGRLIASGDHTGSVEWLSARLSDETAKMLLQGDMTALVSGRPTLEFRQRLELLAEAESKGGASLYRFTEPSLRRGYDAGLEADTIIDWLTTYSNTPVPQPLAYLVRDVGRRYATVRVVAAQAVVRSEDPALLTEVSRHKKTAKLRLRQIAPTVLVTDSKPSQVLNALHTAGYLAAEESGDGDVMVKPAELHRARLSPRRYQADRTGEVERAEEAARRLDRARHSAAAGAPSHDLQGGRRP